MSVASPQRPSARQPWRWASADFSLGLRAVRPGEWIEFSASHALNMCEKRARLTAEGGRYYRTLPESLAAQHELRDRVVAHLLEDHPDRYTRQGSVLTSREEGLDWALDAADIEPLRQLADIVEEDFMLLQPIDGRLRISASSNAYSTSGRLVAAVGKTIDWAHLPVPLLTEKLGTRIDRVLDSVHENTPCERFNWQVTPMATLFFPHHNPHEANAAAMRAVRDELSRDPQRAGELLHVRVERQTLTRLPASRAVAFSLHTYSDPLSVVEADREAALKMLRLLEAYSGSRWQYSEMDIVREPLLAYLRQWAAVP